MKRLKLLALLMVLAMVAAACGGDSDGSDSTQASDTTQTSDSATSEPAGEPLSVVVSTTVWGDVVSNVVGDNADVEVLFPIGADPHGYQVSAAQAAAMQQADLVVVNGLTLEEGLHDVIEGLEADDANVLVIAGLLDPIPFGESDEDDHDEEGHEHEDDGVVAHACGHFDDEPVNVSTGGMIPNDHTRYTIELVDGLASVTLDWDEASELSFFLGADVPISLTDAAGSVLTAEATETIGDECEAVAVVATFDFEPGSFAVEIGPLTGAETLDLVWEETGHDDHEGEDADHDEHEGEDADEDEEGHVHEHGSLDPHIWMDPLRVADAVELIATELAALDSSVDWEASATAYADQLRALDAEIVSMLAAVPEERRKLVTNHGAFGYFAERYGFEVVGTVIPSGSTLADPSSAELAELVEVLVHEGINVIFTETTEPAALAEAVAAEVEGVQVVELFTGSLGAPGSGGETYVDFIRTNASRIADALS